MFNLPFWPFNLGKSENALSPSGEYKAKDAAKLILNGQAPDNMKVQGVLNLSGSKTLTRLPSGLKVTALNLTDCSVLAEIPSDLQVKRINLTGCSSMWCLPSGFECYELVMRNSPLISVPEDLVAKFVLNLGGSAKLESLPQGLKTGILDLNECSALTSLPEGLDVSFLNISGCSMLKEWPVQGKLQVGGLRMRGCHEITSLPKWIEPIAHLDLRGCSGITELPEHLEVTSWIDIAGTSITRIPDRLKGVQLRWKGIPIDERLAFRPEAIEVAEVLEEQNVERRRILLERLGYERFLQEARAEILDRDSDPGGARKLLKVAMARDEDLVCLDVTCPSTGRQYILRVPPSTRTCKQAAAWIAGFDNPNDYRPLKET